MNKLEKHFIKSIVKDILEIEAEALYTSCDDFDNSYAAECFAEEIYTDINYYINIMVDRDVNKNIINQLTDLNNALFNHNIHRWCCA